MGSVDVSILTVPTPLSDHHALEGFHCSELSLEQWLLRRARQNQAGGASRTYVVCHGNNVIGYYCLSAGSVTLASAPGNVRRNMPDPIPVVVLGRLAAHSEWSNKGIGKGLLKDAILRSARIAEELGVRALLCHAISEDAKRFYLKNGFLESPIEPMMLMLNLSIASLTL